MADDERSAVWVIAPCEGQSLMRGFAIHKLSGEETGGAYSVVEHNLQPYALAAPMHTHHDVDEVSYVLEGEVGARIGEQEIQAGPGAIILKPCGIPHTFWNAGSSPARLLELISPPGFERYFEELDQLLATMDGQPDLARISELAARYGMEMDFSSIPELMEKHNVTLGG